MADSKKSKEELLEELLASKALEMTLSGNPPNERGGLFEVCARISDLRTEIIARMSPDEPPQTKTVVVEDVPEGKRCYVPADPKRRPWLKVTCEHVADADGKCFLVDASKESVGDTWRIGSNVWVELILE